MLARRQAEIVAATLRAAHPQLRTELVCISTRGDRTRGPLAPVGGKGLFTAELDRALRAGEVDLAVHSAKDLPALDTRQTRCVSRRSRATEGGAACQGPASGDDDVVIAAVPPREDPRDALVSRFGPAEDLPGGASVGTGSPRRAAQLAAIRDDLQIVPVRGNVETRVRKALSSGGGERLDAVVLAMAGLLRSGLAGEHRRFIHPFAPEQFIPAAGQGCLAVQCLAGSADVRRLLSDVDDAESREVLLAERGVPAALGASCRSCIAVHVLAGGASTSAPARILAMVAHGDGSGRRNFHAEAETPALAARRLVEEMLRENVQELLRD